MGAMRMWAQIDTQSIIKANSQFWEQMLAMTLDPSDSPMEFPAAVGHVWGCVELAGNWKGRIEVRMTQGLAYQATAAMMMLSPALVTTTTGLPRTITQALAGAPATITRAPPPPAQRPRPEASRGRWPTNSNPGERGSQALSRISYPGITLAGAQCAGLFLLSRQSMMYASLY